MSRAQSARYQYINLHGRFESQWKHASVTETSKTTGDSVSSIFVRLEEKKGEQKLRATASDIDFEITIGAGRLKNVKISIVEK